MKINCKQFIEKYYSNQSSTTISKARSSIRNIESLVEDVEQLQQNDIELYSKIFSLKSTGNQVSRGKYYETKALLVNLEDFLGEKFCIPKREELLDYSIPSRYFYSLDELLKKIDTAVMYNPSLKAPYERILFLKGIVVLGWYGLSLQQITELEKENVKLDNMCVVVGDSSVRLQPQHFEIIREIKLLRQYKISKDVIINQLKIKWMFSCTDDKVSTSALTQRIAYFNKNIPDNMSFSINFELLYRNNVFVELLNYETENKTTLTREEVITFFTKKLQINTRRSAINRYADYTLWKSNYSK